jgi:hypothetical protein
LDVVLEFLNLLLEVISGDLSILNDTVDLELLDTETNGDELVTTPDKTVHFNGLDVSKHLLQVSLVIPWLNFQSDDGLGSWTWTLGSLLGLVLLKTLLLELLSLFINFFVVRAKEINIVFVVTSSTSFTLWAVSRSLLSLVTWKGVELRLIGSNVLEPTSSMWERRLLWSLANGLVDSNIGLRWVGTFNVGLVRQEVVESLVA